MGDTFSPRAGRRRRRSTAAQVDRVATGHHVEHGLDAGTVLAGGADEPRAAELPDGLVADAVGVQPEACRMAAGLNAGRRPSGQRGDVEPPAILADEPAVLLQYAASALVDVVGAEPYRPLGVEQRAALGAEDLQAQEAGAVSQIKVAGPGVGVPGAQQVAGVARRERGETRPHKLLGGRRAGGGAVPPAAAVVVRRSRPARAGGG